MDAFDVARLRSGHDFTSGEPYLEFIRTATLSVGLYVLAADATDTQSPHTEDEVYHVVGGRARIRVGGEDRAVGAGTVVFVGAGVEHRFHSIEEDLTVLVFFAPAEYARVTDEQAIREKRRDESVISKKRR
jgi:mannose-6-phosphate isomerase-like protein (cupin superfamily)